MGMFSEDENEWGGLDPSEICEAFIVDELMHNCDDATVQEFCAPGGRGEALTEATLPGGVRPLGRRSLMLLSKISDFNRRTHIIAILLAKKNNSPDYAKLVKFNALRKQARARIFDRYGMKAQKIAKKAQMNYIKNMRSVNKSFAEVHPDQTN